MRVVLLGTGSADGWPNAWCTCASCTTLRARGDVRRTTSALVDDALLLDCGPDTLHQASAAGVALDRVRAVVVTHAHPDHLAVTRIVEDARFDAKLTGLPMPGDQGQPPIYPKWLFYYYCSHLRRVPDPTFVMDTAGYSERKIRSIRAYESQFVVNEKNREVVAWIESCDRYFGSRIGTRAGEAFFTKEPLGLTGLGELA